MSDLRVAIVTGGATGIGFAAALRLARDGYHALIVNRRAEAGRQAVERIRADGGAASNVAMDLCDSAAVAALVAGQPRIDAVVNCAGAFLIRPFAETPPEAWRRLFAVNVGAVWSLCRRALSRMGPGSAIVNVASRGYLGSPQLSAYGASKAGLVGLTRALAMELVHRRIGVNAIAPGMIETPLLHESLDERAYAAARAQQPGGHVGAPDDVAKAIAYAIAGAPFLTGQVICVDGGKSVIAPFVG